ncbi:MAG: 3-deoxy-D-manno-octulosonic acid transferase [Cyanobacteria bacterium K_Offshore_0m_m2_072]|nr:3-deoxy-D-manno-octulosonic acid transferase [Cyanobacteria bacterium K_Offshore_0m_m2_072]
MPFRPRSPLLVIYLLLARLLPFLAVPLLRRRLGRGKEDPQRWREKLAEPTASRPTGALIWCHAVGLGEVLALRGLIGELAERLPQVSFLITSTARSSAQVLAANLPPRTVHQFLPLDAPSYLRRFFEHWRPQLSIWTEQELWPGAVLAAASRGIPLALVNARLGPAGHRRRRWLRGLYGPLLRRFALLSAQDSASAARLEDLGAAAVRVDGSLKPAAPLLQADLVGLQRLQALLAGRRLWLAASTHPGDEAEAIAAQRRLPGWLLILVPRDPRRADAIAAQLAAAGLPAVRRSRGETPDPEHAVWLADSYGELGLWYRLAPVALVGGGFDRIGGHNPWEPAALGAAVLHGPDVANFTADYAMLHAVDAARAVAPGALAAVLQQPDLPAVAARASALVRQQQGRLAPLARDLAALIQPEPSP